MKHVNILLALAVAGAVCSCSSKHDVAITTTPAPYVVTPTTNNLANIDMTMHVPSDAMSKRSRLIVLPQVYVADTLFAELHPVVLQGNVYAKKQKRRMALTSYRDPYAKYVLKSNRKGKSYDFGYTDQVYLPDDAVGGRVMGVVTTDGCGQCSAIDTVTLAYITMPASLLDMTPHVSWTERTYKNTVKEHNGNAEARLQFIINKYDIEPDLANNRAELQSIIDSLNPVLGDSLSILRSMSIYGTASADGPHDKNITLAQDRANSTFEWLSSQFRLSNADKRRVKVGASPEGWEPVVQAMIAANDPDSTLVRNIMKKYPGPTDDEAERYIRKLECWPRIADNYLAKDRKVQLTYSWTVRSFETDKDKLEMYRRRPDAFSEDELLRVAQITEGNQAKKEVYQTTLRYYPLSDVAANNLACLLIDEGNADAAVALLDRMPLLSDNLRNDMGAAKIMLGDLSAATDYLMGSDTDDARYNLGLIFAKTHEYDRAYEMLAPFADVNTAIVAICLGMDQRAADIIDNMYDQTPLSEYVGAMAAARLGNSDKCMSRLLKAVKDPTLKERAGYEPDFAKYHDDLRFISILR